MPENNTLPVSSSSNHTSNKSSVQRHLDTGTCACTQAALTFLRLS